MDWSQLLSFQRMDSKASPTESASQIRSEFERDFDRIIFSHPFRRLQDKTQVIPLPEDDFVHTRLTHSLEVSSVGRSLGKLAGETIISRNPDLGNKHFNEFDFGAIVAAACLAHDLGNPPFGHSGESAISNFFKNHPLGRSFETKLEPAQWSDLVHFEGNAQGFRILNKKQYQGLNLTLATLAAFTKYPRESLIPSRDPSRASQKKFGFFQTEKKIFKQLAGKVGLKNMSTGDYQLWGRHPLAFLVEAADDICYHIIDLEDGCRLGLVGFEKTKELLIPILGDQFSPAKFNSIKDQNEGIGVLRALAINELIRQATQVFIDCEKDILEGNFDKPLTAEINAQLMLNEIITISVAKIYRSKGVIETETTGFEVMEGLLESITGAAWNYHQQDGSLSPKQESILQLVPIETNPSDQQELSDYELLMNCVDFVAGLTDSNSVNLYRKIQGISRPGR